MSFYSVVHYINIRAIFAKQRKNLAFHIKCVVNGHVYLEKLILLHLSGYFGVIAYLMEDTHCKYSAGSQTGPPARRHAAV